jgi:hypothetical protein
MESYIDNEYKKIETKFSDFFKSKNTSLQQYVIVSKKSEKFAPLQLDILLNKELPEEIKNEVRELYRPILGEISKIEL